MHVSEHGIWLFAEGRELFMPFTQFPWFRTATIVEVMNVDLVGPGHLYWADLDVDLAIDSIEHPEKFPLVSRVPPRRASQPSAGSQRRKKSVSRKRPRRG